MRPLTCSLHPTTIRQLDSLGANRSAALRALVASPRLTRAGLALLPPANVPRGPGRPVQFAQHRQVSFSIDADTWAALDRIAAASVTIIGADHLNRSRTVAALIASAI